MTPSPLRIPPLVGVVCVSGLLIAAVAGGPAPAAPRAAVPPSLLADVLGDEPVSGGVAADELLWFEARRAEDPGNPLVLRRLTALRLLRFRAYGEGTELEAARATLAVLRARDTRDPAALSMEASLALATHDFPRAVLSAEARRGVGDPATGSGRLAHFDALWAVGRYHDARRLLESEPQEESMALLARRARLVDGLGDTDAAARAMGRVVELSDAYAEPAVVRAWARVEHGNFLFHSGQPAAAALRYREAMDLVPALPAALEGLGWLAWGVDGDPDVAEALFSRALEVGGHLDLYGVLGDIARFRGDSARARTLRSEFLDAALATPESRRTYRRPLAFVLAEDDDRLAEALALAEADLAARQDRMAWTTRGWILHLLGRTSEARTDMERALAWGAPEPEVSYRAGMVLLEGGQHRRGRRLLERALEGRAELGPGVVEEIRAVLDGRGPPEP